MDPVAVLDPARLGVARVHRHTRLSRFAAQAGHAVMLRTKVGEDASAGIEDERIILGERGVGERPLLRLRVDRQRIVAVLV